MCHVLDARDIGAEGDAVHDEALRPAIVDARSVEADRGDVTLVDQQVRIRAERREVQIVGRSSLSGPKSSCDRASATV